MMRRCSFLLLAVLWASAPVLACLPSAAMTDAEMACCKKMAGNCDMASGSHSCCKTMLNTSNSVTAIAQNPQAHSSPAVSFAVASAFSSVSPGGANSTFRFMCSPLLISPPGSQQILRI
jgi:hypothetical protein